MENLLSVSINGSKAEIESLRQQLAEKDVEVERLKAVPMKYRRMAFNAQLQDENEQLRQQLAEKDAEIERLNSSPTIEACRQMIQDKAVIEASVLHGQLVASQAREAALRAEIDAVAKQRDELLAALGVAQATMNCAGIDTPGIVARTVEKYADAIASVKEK